MSLILGGLPKPPQEDVIEKKTIGEHIAKFE
jgi:hypothetical protein